MVSKIAATMAATRLSHDFVVESDSQCNLKISQNSRVLFESDSQLINIGHGYVDHDKIMINGNLNQMPEPHVYRSLRMHCNELN